MPCVAAASCSDVSDDSAWSCCCLSSCRCFSCTLGAQASAERARRERKPLSAPRPDHYAPSAGLGCRGCCTPLRAAAQCSPASLHTMHSFPTHLGCLRQKMHTSQTRATGTRESTVQPVRPAAGCRDVLAGDPCLPLPQSVRLRPTAQPGAGHRPGRAAGGRLLANAGGGQRPRAPATYRDVPGSGRPRTSWSSFSARSSRPLTKRRLVCPSSRSTSTRSSSSSSILGALLEPSAAIPLHIQALQLSGTLGR